MFSALLQLRSQGLSSSRLLSLSRSIGTGRGEALGTGLTFFAFGFVTLLRVWISFNLNHSSPRDKKHVRPDYFILNPEKMLQAKSKNSIIVRLSIAFTDEQIHVLVFRENVSSAGVLLISRKELIMNGLEIVK